VVLVVEQLAEHIIKLVDQEIHLLQIHLKEMLVGDLLQVHLLMVKLAAAVELWQ
jgi:hypothetical protein